jgi:hypothetical protein
LHFFSTLYIPSSERLPRILLRSISRIKNYFNITISLYGNKTLFTSSYKDTGIKKLPKNYTFPSILSKLTSGISIRNSASKVVMN